MYLDGRLTQYLKGHTESESWQLADLARGLIIAGLTIRHLHAANPASMERFVTVTAALNYLGHSAVPRWYSPRGLGRG